MSVVPPLRLRLDGAALADNWRWLDRMSGKAACGAAIKADAYGLGAAGAMARLAQAGCRDFFVSNWVEAEALMPLGEGLSLSVLHGVRAADMAVARDLPVRPVLNTADQVRRWRDAGGGVCDVMVDTGMNRLGIAPEEIADGLLDGIEIDTLLSHLACADEDVATNAAQRTRFAALARCTNARRMSLANSAGICLGKDYAFDLTRPGVALYGGIVHPLAEGAIRPVVQPEAQVIQRRRIRKGEGVGYNATFIADRDIEAAVLNIGYADGYLRAFSNIGSASRKGVALPVIGRVSMDLTIIAVDAAPDIAEGDWISIDYDLRAEAARTGFSQYELLTLLGARYAREWS